MYVGNRGPTTRFAHILLMEYHGVIRQGALSYRSIHSHPTLLFLAPEEIRIGPLQSHRRMQCQLFLRSLRR